MARIAPFRGLRYNPARIANMEEVVTPPYDVIDEKAHSALIRKNPYNMVQLDLSKHFEKDVPLDERYAKANKLFEQWQAESILIRDNLPTVYLYDIEYVHPSGRQLTRRGLVCLVQLAEFDEGIVKPHEKTFKQYTTDRLRLLDTCQTQFSKIFSLYPDPKAQVMSCLDQAANQEPLCTARDLDGNRHVIRAVTSPQALRQMAELFHDKSLYIADGHHRYTTALQYRDLARERLGILAPNSPYNFTMMYLCPMEEPGLSVLPTHRLARLPGAHSVAKIVEKLSPFFVMEEMHNDSREVLVAEALSKMDEERDKGNVFGFYHPLEDRCFSMVLRPGVMAEIFKEVPVALRALDVVVLSELILDRCLGLDHKRCEAEKLIEYFSDPDEALDVAVKESTANLEQTPVLFLLNHTPVSQVREVADASLVMPHKSTFFYPKVLTGLVMNKIVGDETVL